VDLESFYDEHIDKVYKFFYIKCLNRDVAEDLTSETFTLFMKQAEKVDVQDATKYLYGIMRNVWLGFLKEKYAASLQHIEDIADFETHAQETVSEFEAEEPRENRLLPFINKLPERQRKVLVMRSLQGKSVQETATELGKDKNYVKTTYHRALKSLRVILDTPYIENEEVA
jgi:RNA polymerase sigma-70 factor (ECF subfamily)